jgi:hypothetical protein
MALPASGEITYGQVIQLLKGAIQQLDFNDQSARNLANKRTPGEQIALSDFWGKSLAGNTHFDPANGYACGTTYTFLTPSYNTLTLAMAGGGGAGGGGDNHNAYGIGNNGYPGNPGGTTTFNAPAFYAYAEGGGGGPGNAGAWNVALGYAGTGGSSPAAGTGTPGGSGNFGYGCAPQQGGGWGGGGGAGGLYQVTFNYSDPYSPKAGQSVSLIFGCGGTLNFPGNGYGTNGGTGYVNLDWM